MTEDRRSPLHRPLPRAAGALLLLLFLMSTGTARPQIIDVDSRATLIESLSRATPGTTIRLASGTYRGGMHFTALHGEADRPITLTAADPENPPVLRGGSNLIQLSGVSHLVIEHLVLEDATGNGLNIDDAGELDKPTHHLTLRNLTIRNIGPDGNHDGIKLSGVVDFAVVDCTITDWGAGGSAIDMVGCHRGVIRGCTIARTDTNQTSSGVQCKGGTSDIRILACQFDNAGARHINLGGSTGRPFFRPALAPADNAEARNLEVAGCVFKGPGTPTAFVGVDGANVHHNTILHPSPWAMRILQETTAEDFVPCRDVTYTDNLIVFNRADLRTFVNIGGNTAPDTFTFARNWWYCVDAPDRSRPNLPTSETDSVYGRAPMLNDDGTVAEGSPASTVGAHAWRE